MFDAERAITVKLAGVFPLVARLGLRAISAFEGGAGGCKLTNSW